GLRAGDRVSGPSPSGIACDHPWESGERISIGPGGDGAARIEGRRGALEGRRRAELQRLCGSLGEGAGGDRPAGRSGIGTPGAAAILAGTGSGSEVAAGGDGAGALDPAAVQLRALREAILYGREQGTTFDPAAGEELSGAGAGVVRQGEETGGC